MESGAWNKFVKARERFRKFTEKTALSLPGLLKIQQKLADSRGESKSSFYKVETPVVYNTALDEVTTDSEIKLILVADNPGRREQAAENRRYLAGPSGKIAHKFFRDNPALGVDFLKNVIILNKTPIHSPRTVELRELCKIAEKTGGAAAAKTLISILEQSQKTMASLLVEFQLAFGAQVWITGYSEMKNGGIFEVYAESLKKLYAEKKDLSKSLFIFRHFSMNQFTIDLKQQAKSGETVSKSLQRIGSAYREKILGLYDKEYFP